MVVDPRRQFSRAGGDLERSHGARGILAVGGMGRGPGGVKW